MNQTIHSPFNVVQYNEKSLPLVSTIHYTHEILWMPTREQIFEQNIKFEKKKKRLPLLYKCANFYSISLCRYSQTFTALN